MTRLADELRNPRRYGQIPRLTLILNAMPDAEREEWLEVLGDPTITSVAIWRKLNSMGHRISRVTIQEYRLKGNP